MTRDWTNEYWNIPDDAKDSFEELKKELSDSRKYQAIQNDDIARLRNFLKIVKKLLIGIKQIVDMLICQQKIYIKHWIMLIIKELEELLQKA